jgi:hypothetical protein
MSVRTCFIGTQHTEDTPQMSRKPEPSHSLVKSGELGAALEMALTLGSQLIAPQSSIAQVNGVGQRPYLGWSTFSEQTLNSSFLTQANITTQSDALAASGLQAHGFDYINIDSGWQGSFDANGRPIPNTTTFPNITALVEHIHHNSQKAGINWIPGVEYPAVVANSPILGTPYHIQDILVVRYTAGNAFGSPGTSPYHYKIDFTKPGAQQYMNSVVALFASWGIDFIKLDGVTPGSDRYGTAIDNRPDVEAWSKAIAVSGAARHRVTLQLHHAAPTDDCAGRWRRARRSRPASSFGENMQRVAVAVHDVLRFRHPFLEAGIVGSELVASIRSFDQEQSFAIRGVQTADYFLGQYDPKRVPELAHL